MVIRPKTSLIYWGISWKLYADSSPLNRRPNPPFSQSQTTKAYTKLHSTIQNSQSTLLHYLIRSSAPFIASSLQKNRNTHRARDITFQPLPLPPKKQYLVLAMGVLRVNMIGLTCFHIFRLGIVKSWGRFEYVRIPPAPEHFGYAASVWYYLSHRQCFNQFLDIMTNCVVGISVSKLMLTDYELALGVLRWWEQLPLILPASYLASGLLTAWDARNGRDK